MTDAPGAGPPEKRERRPGQEAAPLGKTGKVNKKDNATKSVALSSAIDAAVRRRKLRHRALDRWQPRYGHKIYPALLPHGIVSEDGSKLRVGDIEIDLRGPTAGHCVDNANGARGYTLFDLAKMTGRPWPETLYQANRIIMAELIGVDHPPPVRVAKPNGHDCLDDASPTIDADQSKPNGPAQDHHPIARPGTGPSALTNGSQSGNGRAADHLPFKAADPRSSNAADGPAPASDDLAKGLTPNEPVAIEAAPGAKDPIECAPAATVSFDEAKAAAAALTRNSGPIAIRQVIEKIAMARPGALFEEQLLLLVHDQTGTGKKALNTELRDAKRREAAATPQQVQSYNATRDWRRSLIKNEWGEPKPLMTNVCLALGDQVWQGVLGFNEFTGMIAMRRAAPWIVNMAAFEERAWTDADTRMATTWIQAVAHTHASSLVVFEGIQTVAEQHPYHPVRDYLDALTHDGSPRIDDLLIRYYGAGGDPPRDAEGDEPMEKWRRQYAYHQAVGARFLIGAVARIYQPGCKNDCMPNFVGAQGALKSSSLAALFDPWFTDEIADLGSKDAAMQSAGVWCVEISELAAISRVATERVKAWLSRQKDRFRPPYGRLIKEQPRQSVAAGTTNVDNFLVDDTGNRRMWSVRCASIDIDALRADRDQLWAEARDRYRRGEKWWLHESSLVASAAEVQAEFTDDDIWTESVMGYIAKLDSIGIPELLRDCIGIFVKDQTQSHARRVASILRRAGWTRKQVRVGGKQFWRYFPHGVTTSHGTGDGTGDS